MKIIAIILAALLGICVITHWVMPKPAVAQEVKIKPLPPMPMARADLGWTLGSRYTFNADDSINNNMRVFARKNFLERHSLELAWTRDVGNTANFFRYSTQEGRSYRNTGDIFIEYSYSF